MKLVLHTERLTRQLNVHNIKLSSEADNADLEVAHKYPEELKNIITEDGYTTTGVQCGQYNTALEAHACQEIYFYGGNVNNKV